MAFCLAFSISKSVSNPYGYITRATSSAASSIKISKKEFLQAIKNISLYCNESTNQIKIEIKNEELLLTAENIDIKKKAVIKLPCESKDANITIGFNHKLLSTIVSICKHEYIHLLLDSPSRAAIIKDDANERCTMLLMPVMLNN